MAEKPTMIDIHMKSLDYFYEVKGIDPLADDINMPATVATILYMLLEDKEEDENESI